MYKSLINPLEDNEKFYTFEDLIISTFLTDIPKFDFDRKAPITTKMNWYDYTKLTFEKNSREIDSIITAYAPLISPEVLNDIVEWKNSFFYQAILAGKEPMFMPAKVGETYTYAIFSEYTFSYLLDHCNKMLRIYSHITECGGISINVDFHIWDEDTAPRYNTCKIDIGESKWQNAHNLYIK